MKLAFIINCLSVVINTEKFESELYCNCIVLYSCDYHVLIVLMLIYLALRKVDWLMSMQAKDFTVSSMHGDLDQKERDTIVRIGRTASIYRYYSKPYLKSG